MEWLKLYTDLPDHYKLVGAGGEDGWHLHLALYVSALCYCGKHETDGRFPRAALRMISSVPDPKKVGADLARAGLFQEDGEYYLIAGYTEKQRSKEQLSWARGRRRLYAGDGVGKAVKERDGDKCRYCGGKVNWKDRRSDAGATYDHVGPGDSTLENVVVACMSCNRKKGNRTPEQAGMTLLPVPQSKSRSKSELDRSQFSSNSNSTSKSVSSELQEWLHHHQQTTGLTPPRLGTKALADVVSAFEARRAEGYTLEDLKLATVGAFNDEHRQKHGYFGTDSVLRPSKVHNLIENGRRRPKESRANAAAYAGIGPCRDCGNPGKLTQGLCDGCFESFAEKATA